MSEQFNAAWERLLDDGLTGSTDVPWSSLIKGFRHLPLFEPSNWCSKCALRALSIRRVPFVGKGRRVAGYSEGRDLAINPKIQDPLHTLIHEMTHIVLKHSVSKKEDKWDEFTADATAYVVMHELKVEDQMHLPVARLVLQKAMKNETPSNEVKRNIFSATGTIIDAGRHKAVI